MNRETLLALASRVEQATGPDLYDFSGLPHWAAYGGEHYDGGWTPDCCGKADFDPGLLRLSSRVWPDGSWICSLYFGDDIEIESTGICKAESKTLAKAAVEEWCQATAKRWARVIAASLRSIAEGNDNDD